MYIDIIIESKDRLSQKYWEFWIDSIMGLNQFKIVLNIYAERSRITTRHKMKNDYRYHRLFGRENTIKTKDIVIPEEIKKQLKDKLNNIINETEITI